MTLDKHRPIDAQVREMISLNRYLKKKQEHSKNITKEPINIMLIMFVDGYHLQNSSLAPLTALSSFSDLERRQVSSKFDAS
jgi:hypothetical protein